MSGQEAQTFSVKRAEVEFHNFASFGEPERAMAQYAEENRRRGELIRKHLGFMGELTPFLDLGANAGHTSYMLTNEFGASGFALDLSADSLRHGMALKEAWGLTREPLRLAGDAAHLPFADGSLRLVAAFQMLSQFQNMERVFLEVKRVLAPGGIFLFGEEAMKRLLSLRLYRCPYYQTMQPWERKLYDWGLLGYIARDVIGADQEESFGIRQNYSMGLKDWSRLIRRHFAEVQFEMFVPEQGWGERVLKRAATRLDPHRCDWTPARLLGGVLAAVCRKAGEPAAVKFRPESFEEVLRCPDCGGAIRRDPGDVLRCAACEYRSPNEGGVYNLLPSRERAELYPGDREDTIDFSQPGHEKRLLGSWYQLEGVFGNRYRWIGASASARLAPVTPGTQQVRIRGHAAEGHPAKLTISANGARAGEWVLARSGLFVLEADLPDAKEYVIDIQAGPTWSMPPDDRILSVNLSMLRLQAKF